jgi:hypothetical protein
MAKKEELFIINDGGQILHHVARTNENNEDQDQKKMLTASYLTAILQFAKAASHGQMISTFELGKSKIFIKSGQKIPLYFILIVDKKAKIKDKKVDKAVSLIVEGFEGKFSKEEIDSWDGDVDAFKSCSDFIKQILKKNL